MSEDGQLKRTPLYRRHMELGARMVPFGGYHLPLQYQGILAEHKAARTQAAIFDTCHMGELHVSGRQALNSLQSLLSCDLANLYVGQCRYGFMCNPEGGVLDDLIVYRLSDDAFMLVVNSETQDRDYEWIKSRISEPVQLRNISPETAKVDIQGPGAPRIMQSLLDQSIEQMKYYEFKENTCMGRGSLVSRTGYTGEIGFEIYTDPETVDLFWNECLAEGAVASGLGARNTLRLEIGLPLYGHELGPKRNVSDSGMDRFISKTKQFIGSSAIRGGEAGRQRLVGISLEGRQAAREGNRILSENAAVIGEVTSGSYAPTLGYAIALGYVDNEFANIGTKVRVKGSRNLQGRIQETPFYKNGTARNNMSEFL